VEAHARENQPHTDQDAGGPGRLPRSIWSDLSSDRRRLVLTAIVLGLVQLLLVDVYFRVQELPAINQYLSGQTSSIPFPDGIQYPPFVLSGLVYALLVALSVIVVNERGQRVDPELSWLGSAWLLASIPLVLDLLIDTFELKWPVILLFVFAGLRYWRGVKNNALSLVLAPAVAAIAAADGLGHLGGQFCPSSGLDSCPAKAVSDVYLVMMLLVLTYFTLKGRDRRPGWLLVIAAVAIPALLLASFAIGDLF
jgi:hypothetical protein